MPIGAPPSVPEPKSAWAPSSAPIESTICADRLWTGRSSTAWFQWLDLGKIGQPAVCCCSSDEQPATASASTARGARLKRNIPVLALRPGHALGLQRLQRVD